MKKSKLILTILILICISQNSFSQTKEKNKIGKTPFPDSIVLKKISLSDSIELNKVATEVFKAFENKDTKTIKKYSLKLIHCDICHWEKYNYVVGINSFINQFYEGINYDYLFGAIKKRGFRISERLMLNCYPKYLPNNNEKDLVAFEVLVMTYEPNDLCIGDCKTDYCFYFVKIKKEFKFFMYDCIPK